MLGAGGVAAAEVQHRRRRGGAHMEYHIHYRTYYAMLLLSYNCICYQSYYHQYSFVSNLLSAVL